MSHSIERLLHCLFALKRHGSRVSSKKKGNAKKKQTGAAKTWWHPVFAWLVGHLLGEAYETEKEVAAGQLPKSIDLVARKIPGKSLPTWFANAAKSVFSRLNEITLFEFKGPTANLRYGDMGKAMSRLTGWHPGQKDKPGHEKVTLIFVAPGLSKGFEEELELWGMKAVEVEKGIHKIEGMLCESWVISTTEGAKRGEPLLALMSSQFLKKPTEIVDNLAASGYLEILTVVIERVCQFRKENPTLPIPTFELNNMVQISEDALKRMIDTIGSENVVKHVPYEERLKGVPAEERLKGVPAEERLKGLSEEELERVRRLIAEEEPE